MRFSAPILLSCLGCVLAGRPARGNRFNFEGIDAWLSSGKAETIKQATPNHAPEMAQDNKGVVQKLNPLAQNSWLSPWSAKMTESIAQRFALDTQVFFSIVLTLVQCTITPLGLTLQKIAHANKEDNSMYFLRVRWLLGLVLYILGHIVGWVALGLGPQSILSALNCWAMMMSLAFGTILLGEEVRLRRAVSALFLLVGSVILVSAAPASKQAPSASELLWRMGSLDFLGLLGLISVAACITARHLSASLRCALSAAALSWFSVVGAKGISGIIMTSFSVPGVLDITIVEWQNWVVLGVTVALAVSNVHFLNMALQRDEITYVIPFYETVALSGQVIVGGVLFKEFSSFNMTQIGNFILGLVLILIGLISTASAPNMSTTEASTIAKAANAARCETSSL